MKDDESKQIDENKGPFIELDLAPDTKIYNFYDFRDEDVPPFLLLMSKNSEDHRNYIHFTTVT